MKLNKSLLSALMMASVTTTSLGLTGVSEARSLDVERVYNGTFDLGLKGWVPGPGTDSRLQINKVDPKGGPAAVLTTTKAGVSVLADAAATVASVDSGAAFTASVFVKTNRLGQTGEFAVYERSGDRVTDRNIVEFKLSTRTWTKVSVPVKISADNTNIDLKVKADQRRTDQLLVDAVSLIQTQNPTAAPVVPKPAPVTVVPAPQPVPVVQPAPEPTPVPVVQPAPVPTPVPVVQPAPEPTPVPVVQPAPEPTPVPVVQPAPVPTPEVVSDPVSEPSPATTDFLFGMGGGNVDPAAAETRLGNKLEIRRIYHSKGAKVDNVLRLVADDIAKGREASELSFKVPLSWPEMAAGEGDYFFTEVATKLRATVAGTDHRVMLAFNHEPEDDFKSATAAEQDRQRDAWKAMQNRAAGFFADNDNVEYGVIYMGYHSFPNLGSALYPRWSLANATPTTAELDYIGLDVYEDATAPAKFRPFETRYFKPMQAFAAQRGVEWGLSETGLTEEAFNARPTWFTDMAALLKKYDASFFDYFNTNLNSIAGWAMIAGDNREKGFAAALRNERATQ